MSWYGPALWLAAPGLFLSSVVRADDGAALFVQNCALCHQSDAAGLPGQFPRLRGRVGPISAKPPGRAYLIDVVTYGMAGQVTVDKQAIIGVMPPLQLSDGAAAQILSYVAHLGSAGSRDFSAAEVAAERAKPPKTGSEVHALRRSLQIAKVIE
jgi:mono/diheme cytochrome c family protein